MDAEIYPMPSFPLLAANDLEASAKWYQDVLGFQHIFSMPGPGGSVALVHLRWLKYADLLLVGNRDGQELAGPRGVGVTLSFSMLERFGGSVDAFAQQARERGATIASGPLSQPWNVREVTILDPDGYRLTFTAPLDTTLGFDKVLARAAGKE